MTRLLAEVEEYSLLQSSNLCRPLKYGDISSLIRATLEACSKVLARKGTVLEVKAAKSPFTSAAEPRIVAAAVVSLVSAAASANPFGRICANVDTGRSGMIIAVKGDEPIRDKKALALAAAAARVHKGGVALSDGTAAFSIRAGLTGALGFFTAPTVDEILKNPLSAVNIGLGYD